MYRQAPGFSGIRSTCIWQGWLSQMQTLRRPTPQSRQHRRYPVLCPIGASSNEKRCCQPVYSCTYCTCYKIHRDCTRSQTGWVAPQCRAFQYDDHWHRLLLPQFRQLMHPMNLVELDLPVQHCLLFDGRPELWQILCMLVHWGTLRQQKFIFIQSQSNTLPPTTCYAIAPVQTGSYKDFASSLT